MLSYEEYIKNKSASTIPKVPSFTEYLQNKSTSTVPKALSFSEYQAQKAAGTYIGSKRKPDVSTLEGLTEYAKSQGVKVLDEKPKLSFLQRLSLGVGDAFNTAGAVRVGKEKGFGAGLLKYGSDVGKNLASVVTGTDYNPDRISYKDIAKDELGVDNKFAQFGAGFAGDVFLNPTTYLGGAIVKLALKGIGKTASLGLSAATKIKPEFGAAITATKEGLSDALGSAFKSGYKASPGMHEKTMTFKSQLSQMVNQIGESFFKKFGAGNLNTMQSETLSRALASGRIEALALARKGINKDLAARMVTKGLTEKLPTELRPYVAPVLAKGKAMAEAIGITNADPIYFPFLADPKKVNMEKMFRELEAIGIGPQSYLEPFNQILSKEHINFNTADVFFTRESQVYTDLMSMKFLKDSIKQFGKPLTEFADENKAIAAGYRLIKDAGTHGNPLGYLSKWDAKLLVDVIDPSYVTIDMLAKTTGFDAMTSLFKRSVTGVFAPFHVRNFVSGIIQNYEVFGIQALNPKFMSLGWRMAKRAADGMGDDIAAGLAKKALKGVDDAASSADTILINGVEENFDEFMKPWYDRFGADTQYHNDYNNVIKEGSTMKPISSAKLFSKQRAKETLKTGGLGQEGIPFRTGKVVGQFIEHSQKGTAYIIARNMGKSVDEALQMAEKAGFDYAALTKFESQILKRVIPFYSFTRKNLTLQLQTLGEHPERINNVLRFFTNMGEPISADEKKSLPDYIKESLGVKLSSKDGLSSYMSSFGTPIEQFAGLFSKNPILQQISTMNPALKVPIELGFGKDSFRKTDIKDTYNAVEYGKAPKFLKDLLQIREVEKPIYTKNGAGKLVQTGSKIQYVADPERLLIARSLFTARGVSYLNQVFDGDTKGLAKALRLTTGLKPNQIDLESTKYFQDKKKKDYYTDELIKLGKLKEFTNPYITKDTKLRQ